MVSQYREQQRERAIALINNEDSTFDDDIGGKVFRKEPRKYILLDGTKNLFPSIREEAVEYFTENKISWWGGFSPSGHVLSSQIACLNHLFFIRNDLNAVLSLLKAINPDFVEPLPIITDCKPTYIQFEAVSDIDHLNELTSTRGSNCTSIDALIFARHKSGSNWLVPIEWKYTEFYDNQNKATEGIESNADDYKGKIRQTRYNELILNSSQLQPTRLDCYYYEPFYQLMRQTLWAEQMLRYKAVERLKADDYLHVHVIPTENEALLKKAYKCSGEGMETTWRSQLQDQSKYVILPPQKLLSGLFSFPHYQILLQYLKNRYW